MAWRIISTFATCRILFNYLSVTVNRKSKFPTAQRNTTIMTAWLFSSCFCTTESLFKRVAVIGNHVAKDKRRVCQKVAVGVAVVFNCF